MPHSVEGIAPTVDILFANLHQSHPLLLIPFDAGAFLKLDDR